MKINKYFRGDTIVEVMLAVAITSAVLAGAYVATNKSFRAGTDAQERSQALELAEGQLERVKSQSINPDSASNLFDASKPLFCIANDMSLQSVTVSAGSLSVPAQCKSGLYDIFIERVSGTNTEDTYFIARVLWPSISSNTGSEIVVQGNTLTLANMSQVSLMYRVQR